MASPSRALPAGVYRMGMWLALAACSMMFMGLTSAYVASEGLGPAWKQVQIGPLVWIDTAILLLSSVALIRARVNAALSLGILFLAGQTAMFHRMTQEGYSLNSGRQISFVYVLAGLHGLHVLGGIVALAWIAARRRYARLEVVSIYWHFMAVLWLYLLVVLFA